MKIQVNTGKNGLQIRMIPRHNMLQRGGISKHKSLLFEYMPPSAGWEAITLTDLINPLQKDQN